MRVTSLLTLSVLFIATALSCGGGGGSSELPPITYSNPNQAASSQTMGMAVMDTALSTTGVAVNTGTTNIPPYNTAAKRKISTDSISKLNPELKKVIDRMLSRVQAPQVKSSLRKASAPTVRQATSTGTITLTSADGVCLVSGNIVINFTDNSTPDVTDRSATITFNNCQDNTGGIYLWTTGSMTSTEYVTTAPATSNYSLTVNNFTISEYDATFTTLSAQDVMNGAFGALDNGTSGSNTASGSFTMTLYDTNILSAVYSFTNVSDSWTDTVDYLATPMTGTLQNILNGSFKFEMFLNGQSLGSLTYGMTDLSGKVTFNSNGTRDEWYDGSYGIDWTPDPYNCPEGTVTLDTDDDDPLHFVVQSGPDCPISGTLTANNATIQIGSSAGLTDYEIKITVGTVYVTYTDCSNLEGAGGYCM